MLTGGYTAGAGLEGVLVDDGVFVWCGGLEFVGECAFSAAGYSDEEEHE